MKKFFALVLCAVFAASFASAEDQTGGSQAFSPARYALVAAPLLMQSAQGAAGTVQQPVVLKVDTVTGQVWMLQVIIQTLQQPTFIQAVWFPVIDMSSAQMQWQQSLFQLPYLNTDINL